MAIVERADGRSVTEEEQIAALMRLGMSESYARFVLAMERGEIDGDVVQTQEESQ